MSKYCNRFLDDYPGIRADCEDHLKRGLCITCPNRNTNQELKDLRELSKDLRDMYIMMRDYFLAHQDYECPEEIRKVLDL
jgi:hypothetical protein